MYPRFHAREAPERAAVVMADTGRTMTYRELDEGSNRLAHLFRARGLQLYLTDRRAHTIISGGVNIYPKEIEDVLIGHPAVEDVAVFGVTDPEFGEEVKAVVQPRDPGAATPELAAELVAYCRAHLAGFKCPRSIDFDPQLPHLPTGKLAKHVLRSRYEKEGSRT